MSTKKLYAMAMFLFFAARIAFGQAGSADLTGTVSDNAGALLPNAKVTATDTRTEVSSETPTGAGGVYVFTNLRPSVYAVSAEADGFRNWFETASLWPRAKGLAST